jgi:hypothetical protein
MNDERRHFIAASTTSKTRYHSVPLRTLYTFDLFPDLCLITHEGMYMYEHP